MASVRRQLIFDRSANDVWAIIGDPATVHTWFPGMADSTVDGNTRVITTVTGLSMPEEIITNDSIQRRFQYRVTSPIFTSHLGTIDVFDLEDGRSLVSYSTDAEPDALALMIGGATGNALHELRRLLQDGPAPPLP